jgi:uncharacterized membrane protein
MFDTHHSIGFSIHGGGDGMSLALQWAEKIVSMPPAQWLPDLLPGVAALPNLHPLFVHFPITLLGLYFFIELTAVIAKKPQWQQAASWFLYLGTVSAIATLLAGFQAEDTVSHDEVVHEIMEDHEHLAQAVVVLSGLLTAWRLAASQALQRKLQTLQLCIAGVISLLLVFVADLGGSMVYQHGVAVSLPSANAASSEASSPAQSSMPADNQAAEAAVAAPAAAAKSGHDHSGHAHKHSH